MAYIATKPCNFAGKSFMIGDSIPAEYIQPDAVKRLLRMGLIAEANGEVAGAMPQNDPEPLTAESLDITIKAEKAGDEDMKLNVSREAIQGIFEVLTGNVKNAEAAIKEINEDDALILLHMADQRKSVKDLAEARAKELAEAAAANAELENEAENANTDPDASQAEGTKAGEE